MFKLNTEKELYNFLKILAEESVKKSKKLILEEQDPYSDYYTSKRNEEEKMFEQEGESDTAEDTDQKPEMPEDQPEESEVEEPTEEPAAEDSATEAFFASKDRLVDFVNDIRSAPSIKDSAVSEQIDAYYDRLSEEERNVLVFFLRELAKVMTGKASGADARDPSDPPLNIDFVPKDQGETEEPAAEDQAEAQPEESEVEEPTEETGQSPESEEDTSAPIRVNESQDHRSLREKIKKLIG